MELVVVRDGYREIFVEKSCIKEIVLNPRIYEVPGAPQDVRGILFYEGLPVVIRRIGDGEPVCAVIMNGQQESRWGIAGEPAGEESIHSEGLVHVMPGIWEKCSDKTEQQGI